MSTSADRDVVITLTDGQVAQVLRKVSARAGLAGLLGDMSELDAVRSAVLPLLDDLRCSRSALRALLVLAAFPEDGSERDLSDVARQLELSPSTTHRYITTWTAVGLLAQDAHSRRYRRVLAGRVGVERGGASLGDGDAD